MTKTTNTALTIVSANIDINNNGGTYANKTSSGMVKLLLEDSPTFIALQEAGGERELSSKQFAKKLETLLKLEGYDVIYPQSDWSYSVSTRLFYKSDYVKFIKELTPVYDNFYCRQCGSLFLINNQTIAVYSLHFPLYEKHPTDKEQMWDKYIQFASQASKNKGHEVILAGDFNESLINKTTLSHKLSNLEQYMIDASTNDITFEKAKRKLDHIFTTFSTIGECKTIDNPYSDHKMLITNILI